ncbi:MULTISPECIES: HEPN domain-containing protein [Citricoccus]|uniref:HEPN domain-containing protein n=1 Tax=Citricoccus parietis TaxID=592307 RepID=A0ABV6F434_9MICC|nr:HEPN domain-containing protein [Citricoccus sp. K5]
MTEPRQVLLGRVGSTPESPATLEEGEGAFRLYPEKAFESLRQVIPLPTDNGALALSADPQHAAADWSSRTLWGLREGQPFTVFSANMRVGTTLGMKPVYSAHSILWGAHVEDSSVEATAVRLRFSFPPTGWAEQGSVITAAGALSAWVEDNHVDGLEWRPSAPHSIDDFKGGFPQVFTTLFHLWTDKINKVTELQVCIEDVGWCELARIDDGGPVKHVSEPLLSLDSLTLDIVGQWLNRSDQLGPIPFMVFPGDLALQVEAFVVASALEGTHRRLHPDEVRRGLQEVPKAELKRAKKAAKKAGVEALDPSPEYVKDVEAAFAQAVGHVEELTFAERIEHIVGRVSEVAPGLLGPSSEGWIKSLRDIRNTQAHALTKHDDFNQAEVSLYYVMSRTGRWVLRIRLLQELVSDDQLGAALRRSSDFLHTLADIDEEKYWSDFSTYDAFQDANLKTIEEPS